MKKLIALILCLLPLPLAAGGSLKEKTYELLDRNRAEKIQLMKIKAAEMGVLALRSALTVYYADHEGKYPTDLKQLIPDAMTAIPANSIGTLGKTDKVINTKDCTDMCAAVTNEGGWVYCTNPKDENYGTVIINSNQKNKRG